MLYYFNNLKGKKIMALIKCIDCGKEYSERANACPNCGCPTEAILTEIQNTARNKEIIEKYNFWNFEFSIDKDMDSYIKLATVTEEGRDTYFNIIEEQYYKWHDIDELIENMPEYYSEILEELVSTSVKMLTDLGIYDCDINTFMKKYGESLDASLLMEPIIERYLQIQNFETEAKEYREYVRQKRLHTWTGGGFGVKGALKGYFKAQMLNVGTEFLHMYSDNKNHMRNMAEVAKAKAELFKNVNTKNTVLESFTTIYDICNKAVVNEVVLSGIMPPNPFNRNKMIPIYNNVVGRINSGDFDRKTIRQQCIKAFVYDPTFYPLIDIMIRLDDTCEFEVFAEDYGFYERFLREEQIRLENKYSKEILEITDMCYSSIASNDILFEIWDKCNDLDDKGLTTVDKYIKQALEGRVKFSISQSEYDEIIENIWDINFYSDDLLQEVKDIIDNIEIDNTDRQQLIETVRDICDKYSSMKGYLSTTFNDTDFQFSCITDIKKDRNYHKHEEFADIPKNADVFMLWGSCGIYDESPKRTVAITDSGIYSFFKENWTWVNKSWKTFATERFGLTSNSIETGNDWLETTNTELYNLLKEIRKELRKCLELDNSENTIENLPKEFFVCIKNKCCEFSDKVPFLSTIFHHYCNKKDIKEMSEYYDASKKLKLPENIDVYYMYYVDSSDELARKYLVMADSGIYYYASFNTGVIKWIDFMQQEIVKVDKNLIKIGSNEFNSLADAKFLERFLVNLQIELNNNFEIE